MSTLDLALIIICLMLAAVTCCVGYLLIVRYGQVLVQIEALKQQIRTLEFRVEQRPDEPTPATAPPAENSRSSAAADMRRGLARPWPKGFSAGAVLMDFELPDLHGGQMRLSQWQGQPVLLIFINPRCHYSREILPSLARLPAVSQAGRPAPLLISTGDPEENRRLVHEYGIACPVLLQETSEVAARYEVEFTPSAYLVDERRETASALAIGGEAVLALAGLPPLVRPGAVNEDQELRLTSLPPWRSLSRDGLGPGTPAPHFRLPRLGGGELALDDYRGSRFLLVFSDPDCEPCDRVAATLEQYHRASTDPRILLVSRGDSDVNQAWATRLGLTLPIGLERVRETASNYAMFAAPAAYLISPDGVIEDGPAVGCEPVLTLAAASIAPASP